DDISALAAPQARFDPDALVATGPSCETIATTALVVEVFPFVPEIKMTSLPRARSEIASGAILSKIRPGSVSPLLPNSLEAALTNLATAMPVLSRISATRQEYA